MICLKCELEVTDGVLCSDCKGSLHFGCAGLLETTHRKMTSEKKASWRCTTCRGVGNIPTPTNVKNAKVEKQSLPAKTNNTPTGSSESSVLTQLEQGFKSVLTEIKEFRADFGVLRADLQSCKDSVNNIETKLNEFEPRLSTAEDRLSLLEDKSTLLPRLQSDLDKATTIISTLQQECEAREQYSRINNVEISGLPFKKGENLISILENIYATVGLKLEVQNIDNVQRVRRFHTVPSEAGGDNDFDRSSNVREPAVIVKFTRRIYKDELLSAVRARRGITTSSIGLPGPAVNLYLGDHLTPASKMLLKQARELKKENKIAYLWIRDCKILARKTETSQVMVINKNFNFNKFK